MNGILKTPDRPIDTWLVVLFNLLVITGLASLPAKVLAVDPAELLDVDDAFRVSTLEVVGDSLHVAWDIAEDYYLYRHRFRFKSETAGVSLGEPVLPPGKAYTDEFFGDVETYRGQVLAQIPVAASPDLRQFNVRVSFQGCADAGVCYPPTNKMLTVAIPVAQAQGEVIEPVSSQHAGGALEALGLGNDGFNAAPQPIALPVDEAFKFEAIAMSATEIVARFTIADGYYMYRDHFEFAVPAAAETTLGAPSLPAGEPKLDPEFGNVDVYFGGEVEIAIPLLRHALAAENLMLEAKYQGCRDGSICYPPEQRTIAVALPQFAGPAVPRPVATAELEPIGEQDRLAKALTDKGWLTILSFFGFGLLLAFTPCVFPMVPILSGIIAGQGDNLTTRKAFTLSLVYVLAMAVTYTIAGVLAGLFGQNLQALFQNTWVLAGFATVFVLLALSMFGFYELQLPAKWQAKFSDMSNKQSGGSLFGVAIMGVLSALIVGPCVAPPLAAALIYIGQSGDAVLGGLALFALSLGMGTPLLVLGTGAGKFLPQAGPWMNVIKAVFGVGLLALAIWMLERIIDPTIIMAMWGVLLFGSGVYMGAFDAIQPGRSGWYKLWKALGLILVLFGTAELVGAAAGGKDWLQPLKALRGGGGQPVAQVPFVKVKSLDDLQAKLALSNQPAMLDFYADWCVDCKRMDKYTFPELPVQTAMANGLIMKADVTANDDVDQQLMRHFDVIGPPMILFFDRNGEEMRRYRVVGYQKPAQFAQHVEAAFAEASQ